jgi:DNA gyrase/topoisomerase IV subunit B
MQNNTNYDASSVKVLKGLEGVRQSPGMYIGSVDQKGLHHCVKEQISNGVDEYLNGSCTDIWITLNKDGSTTVRDNGRGIPHGIKEDGLSVLSTCFGVLHS